MTQSTFMWPSNVTHVEFKKQIHQRMRNNGGLITDDIASEMSTQFRNSVITPEYTTVTAVLL